MRKHTRPRTRTRLSDWWVASDTARPARAPRANGAVRPKDVPASADGREGRCASPDDRSAHRPPVSFPRSGTALTRRVAYRRKRLRRVTPHPALPPCTARTPWDARPAFKRKQSFTARRPAGKPKCLRWLVGKPVARSTTSTTAAGGGRVSTGGASRLRARPPRPAFGGPHPSSYPCGQSRRPGPRL